MSVLPRPSSARCVSFILEQRVGVGVFLWWLRLERIHLQCRKPRLDPWVQKIPWRREWLPIPVFLPGEVQRQRSLPGYRPGGRRESDTPERLSTQACALAHMRTDTHTLTTHSCTHTVRHTHTQTLTHTATHSYTVTLIHTHAHSHTLT